MCEKKRCSWAGDIPIYIDYHDNEWGRPVHDDNKLFEMLILEGMQAGLNWITVLKKREAFREAFDGFDPDKVARYGEEKIQELAALQQEILQVVCRYVKPNGTLLYSTCTMTKEENEENVHKFLETHTEFELEHMRQCFPYEGCDGFFMAKMHRK